MTCRQIGFPQPSGESDGFSLTRQLPGGVAWGERIESIFTPEKSLYEPNELSRRTTKPGSVLTVMAGAEFFGKYTLSNVADLDVADLEDNEVSKNLSMIDFVLAIGTTLFFNFH